MEQHPVLIAVVQYYIPVVPNSLGGDGGSGNGQGDWYFPNGVALPSGLVLLNRSIGMPDI